MERVEKPVKRGDKRIFTRSSIIKERRETSENGREKENEQVSQVCLVEKKRELQILVKKIMEMISENQQINVLTYLKPRTKQILKCPFGKRNRNRNTTLFLQFNHPLSLSTSKYLLSYNVSSLKPTYTLLSSSQKTIFILP